MCWPSPAMSAVHMLRRSPVDSAAPPASASKRAHSSSTAVGITCSTTSGSLSASKSLASTLAGRQRLEPKTRRWMLKSCAGDNSPASVSSRRKNHRLSFATRATASLGLTKSRRRASQSCHTFATMEVAVESCCWHRPGPNELFERPPPNPSNGFGDGGSSPDEHHVGHSASGPAGTPPAKWHSGKASSPGPEAGSADEARRMRSSVFSSARMRARSSTRSCSSCSPASSRLNGDRGPVPSPGRRASRPTASCLGAAAALLRAPPRPPRPPIGCAAWGPRWRRRGRPPPRAAAAAH